MRISKTRNYKFCIGKKRYSFLQIIEKAYMLHAKEQLIQSWFANNYINSNQFNNFYNEIFEI